jgi:hypothetical protein
VPSPNPLSDEAVSSAEPRDYEGVSVRVVRPEYLVALYLQPGAGTAKRRERVVRYSFLVGDSHRNVMPVFPAHQD